ncbi:MAG: hypothetical protein ABI539_01220 [Acidobacteriota bacterium]
MKTILAGLLVYSMFVLTACPSGQTLQKAQDASAKVATYANSGINLTRELYRSNYLSLENKDRIADGFIALAKAGQAFDAAVANAKAAYGDTAPKDAIAALFATFNQEVVGKFIAVLQSLKLASVVSGNFAATIELLKTAILVVAKAFGKGGSVQAVIVEAGG